MRTVLVIVGVGAAIALGVYVYRRNADRPITRPGSPFPFRPVRT